VQQNPLQSAAAGKICGKQLAARYSSNLRGAVAGRISCGSFSFLECRYYNVYFMGTLSTSHMLVPFGCRLERERKEKEAAAMAAAGIKGKRR